MSEMAFFHAVGWGAIVALAVPLLSLAYTLYREAWASSFLILDENGKVLGEINAESVQRDLKEITELHDRIRHSGHVIVRAAA